MEGTTSYGGIDSVFLKKGLRFSFEPPPLPGNPLLFNLEPPTESELSPNPTTRYKIKQQHRVDEFIFPSSESPKLTIKVKRKKKRETWGGRSGSTGIGALAVGKYIVEGAEVRRRRGLAGVQPRIPHLLLLALLLHPQRLQFDRARDETHIRILLDEVADPPIVVVFFLLFPS